MYALRSLGFGLACSTKCNFPNIAQYPQASCCRHAVGKRNPVTVSVHIDTHQVEATPKNKLNASQQPAPAAAKRGMQPHVPPPPARTLRLARVNFECWG